MTTHSLEFRQILENYNGPEPEQVRSAISRLAGGDVAKAKHYVQAATEDYRDVLWWAQLQGEEEQNRRSLGGMTVNERIFHLGLMQQWDNAVSSGDRQAASQILRRCEISRSDVEAILEKRFGEA